MNHAYKKSNKESWDPEAEEKSSNEIEISEKSILLNQTVHTENLEDERHHCLQTNQSNHQANYYGEQPSRRCSELREGQMMHIYNTTVPGHSQLLLQHQ